MAISLPIHRSVWVLRVSAELCLCHSKYDNYIRLKKIVVVFLYCIIEPVCFLSSCDLGKESLIHFRAKVLLLISNQILLVADEPGVELYLYLWVQHNIVRMIFYLEGSYIAQQFPTCRPGFTLLHQPTITQPPPPHHPASWHRNSTIFWEAAPVYTPHLPYLANLRFSIPYKPLIFCCRLCVDASLWRAHLSGGLEQVWEFMYIAVTLDGATQGG